MSDNKPEKLDNSPEAVEKRKQKAYEENPGLKTFDETSNEWDKKLSGKSCEELYKIQKEVGSFDAENLASEQNAKLISVAKHLDTKACHTK